MVGCADQDPFLFSILREKRNGSSALPRVPFPGLLRYTNCTSLRGAKRRGNPFLRYLFTRRILRNAPPIFFSSCRKEDGPRPGQKKRALNALDLCTVTRLVIAIVGHFRLSGRNRGIGCRICFRAEPLRLALPWVQDEAGCFACVSLLHVVASQCAHWRGNPFLFGRPRGSELRQNPRSCDSPGSIQGGARRPFLGRFN